MGATTEVITNFLPRRNAKNHSAAYKIWHYRFMCTIAQMHLMSAEFLEQGGSVTSGNPAIDRQMANNTVEVQLTPAAMAMYLAEGASIALVQMSDAAKIYQMIHDHLSDWHRALQNSPHTLNPPLEELRMFDALAGAIYHQARFFFRSDPYHGKLFGVLDGLSRQRGGMSRSLPAAQKPQGKPSLPGPETYTPMADSLAKLDADKRNRTWR